MPLPLPSPGPAAVKCVPRGKGVGSPPRAGWGHGRRGLASSPGCEAAPRRGGGGGWAAALAPLFAGAPLCRPGVGAGPGRRERGAAEGGKAAVSSALPEPGRVPGFMFFSGVFLQL